MATPEICPNCGADVPPRARACPECGSCEETGWSEAATQADLGLPDEDFDHDEFVNKEFGGRKAVPHGISPFWWVIGLIVLVMVLMLLIRWR